MLHVRALVDELWFYCSFILIFGEKSFSSFIFESEFYLIYLRKESSLSTNNLNDPSFIVT